MIELISRDNEGRCILCHSGSIDTINQAELRRAVVEHGCSTWQNRYTIAGRASTTRSCDGASLVPTADTSSPARIAETPVPIVAPSMLAGAPVPTIRTATAVPFVPSFASIVTEEEIVKDAAGITMMAEAPGSESFIHGRILGGLGGLATGGVIGGITGFLGGGSGSSQQQATSTRPTSFTPVDPCPGGFQIPGTNRCFEGPFQPVGGGGTAVATIPVSGVAQGIFGALSANPVRVASFRMVCPTGLVLGKDDRCYAKGTIPKKFRKWSPAPRPPVSAADAKAIRKAAAAKGRVKRLAKSVGLHTHSAHRRTAKK